jgi:hypothetical protein
MHDRLGRQDKNTGSSSLRMCNSLLKRSHLMKNASYHAAEGDHTHPVIFLCSPQKHKQKIKVHLPHLFDQDFTGYA